jgi:pilus assembly protein CpaF
MAQVIIVFSTKGGVGKTLIAGNTAVSLALDLGQRVCLLDLDLQVVKDMSKMLNLTPKKAVVDLMMALREKQEFKKEEFIYKSNYGIDFLPCVIRPQQTPYFDPKGVQAVFNYLDKYYDYIIVDAGQSFSEALLAVLNEANLILMVTTPDVLSVYQTRGAIETLQFMRIPISMIKLVLNRAESASSISWHEIKISIPVVDILAQLPSEGKAAGQAVNLGVPVLIDSPKSKLSQAIKKLAETLAEKKDLYTSHVELDQLRIKEFLPEKSGEFWSKEGMEEAPFDSVETDRYDEITQLKLRVHKRLLDELNLKRINAKVFSDAKKARELRSRAQVLVTNFLAEEAGSFINSSEQRKKLTNEILDEVLGLGPLEDLIADDKINDIMVNNKDEVFIERQGKTVLTDKKFISNDQVRVVIERIIAPIGRHIDESSPMVDARLPDGSRVNAIIPPLSLTGPTLTIRKFRKESYKVQELIDMHAFTAEMAEFIRACVTSRKNMIVSGGTGSGKTTILNVLSNYIPENERIITLEDAAELRLNQQHWIRLESRSPNIEGKGAITIRDLFTNTLRMRPDRIIIGECRGMETLDMLQAMNTGHDGSMTTIHANSTSDVLTRLDSMILMSGFDLPIRAIREMIAAAIDVIIHTARLPDGSRKIIQISEIAGMIDETHISLKDIFAYKQTGVDAKGNVVGRFSATGYLPSFMEEMRVRGIPLSEDIFRTD